MGRRAAIFTHYRKPGGLGSSLWVLIMIRSLFFFIASVMATGGTSMAENVSTCPVDMVPIQIMRGSSPRPVSTLSTVNFVSSDTSFNALVTSVTEHLAVKLAQENLCITNGESKARSLVQFAFLRVEVSEENDAHILPLLKPLEARSSALCRMYSPWIDIAIEREPVPSVRAIIRFSERQLLADQAVLSGARDVPSGVAIPLTYDEFGQYLSAYEQSDLYYDYVPRDPPPEKSIEELVPPDILWLLNHTPQTDMPPMETIAMMDAMEWGREGYTKIVIALIDQCFVPGGMDRQYNSVLDVADLVPLEQYKIDMPIIERKVPAR